MNRPYWTQRLNSLWQQKPILWLAGVRRTGKTTLAKTLPNALYLNCDLPRVRNELADIESFMKLNSPKLLILDEVHRLEDPALCLKIIADEFPQTKVLATGSSTLTTRKKFKDTLTDRKRTIHFTPILVEELHDFKVSLKKRILYGGLPPALLREDLDPEFYSEWFDSFYSRDIQEDFEIDKKQPFLKLLELLLIRNGGMAEITEFAKLTGISRPTVGKYLEALESAQAIHVVRPFHENHEKELVHQPKIYGFDTGFICHAKGWETLRDDDCGILFENLVLETFVASGFRDQIRYWRTKDQKELDFVVPRSKTKGPLAIEVKWKSNQLESSAFENFRKHYPLGENWLICSDGERVSQVKKKGIEITIIPIHWLVKKCAELTK